MSNERKKKGRRQGERKKERERERAGRKFSPELEGDKWKPLMAGINELGLVEQVDQVSEQRKTGVPRFAAR